METLFFFSTIMQGRKPSSMITRRRRIDPHDDDDGRADEAMRHKQVRTQTIVSKCSGRARTILVKRSKE
jgi:hypothetical protein